MPDRRPRELVVGMPAAPPYLDDDAFTACLLCQVPIRHRAPLPDRIVLVCLTCYLVHAEHGMPAILTDELAALALEALPVKGAPC